MVLPPLMLVTLSAGCAVILYSKNEGGKEGAFKITLAWPDFGSRSPAQLFEAVEKEADAVLFALFLWRGKQSCQQILFSRDLRILPSSRPERIA